MFGEESMLRVATALLPLSLLGVLPSAAFAAAPAGDAQCSGLAAKVIGNAAVQVAEAVTSGAYQPVEGTSLTDLPAFCRVRGLAKPSPRSAIHFEVWLPMTNWNSRIHMVGNGGYSPNMNFGQMATLLKYGSVAVATDTGHTGDPSDLSFGTGNDDAIADWGFRSVHESIVPAKALTAAFYGKPARKTYFLGCSTGGHQGLVEANRYPDDFDGILGGAPANNRTNLNLSFLWRFVTFHPPGDNTRTIMQPEDLALANRAAMAQCDALDGVRDGVMANPLACKFDVAKLKCSAGKTDSCLTREQVEAMNKTYNPLKRRDTGADIYTGWIVGSEWVDGAGGWHGYWADPRKPEQPMRAEYVRGWAFNDPNWSPWSFDFGKDVDFVHKRVGEIADMNDPDLSAFKERGGKIILYQGWVDPIVSALDTVAYFGKVEEANTNAADFARLFMVPGMGHCSGGPGATNFTFNLNTDADHDAVLALQRWVEEGKAPERIVATRFKDRTPASGVAMTRPLCAWPKVPTYTGKGSTDDAANFICR